jgi:hypothetical protein
MAVDLTPENDQGYPYALGELAAALTWVAEFRTAVGYAKEAAARIAGSQGDVAAAAFLENFMSHGPENMPMSHAADLARDGLRYLGVLRNETWVRFRMYSLFAEEQEAPDFTGILTCRDPEWQRLFEMSREHGWTPVFFPIAPGTRSEIIEHYSHWPALMLLFAGELRRSRLTYRPDEVRDGPLAAAIGWARVALCEAALGELASAAEDVGRATVLARRIGPQMRATTAIGDAGFVLTFVRDRGWERLSAQLGPATQGANVYGIDAAGFAVTAAVAHARLGRGEDAMQALARVLPAIEEGDGRIYGYTRLVCCASEVHWLLDRQDHVALLESKLRDTIVAPDYRAPGVDARRSLRRVDRRVLRPDGR